MRLMSRARVREALILMAALAGLLALGAGVAACGETATTPSSPPSPPSPQASPMPLKVMEFNIEYGGTQISFAKVVEAVKAADPDVVGLEEAQTNTGRLARALGWQYYSNGMQLLSKYPILEPSGSDGAYVLIQVRPGACVAVSNVHLPSEPEGSRIGYFESSCMPLL